MSGVVPVASLLVRPECIMWQKLVACTPDATLNKIRMCRLPDTVPLSRLQQNEPRCRPMVRWGGATPALPSNTTQPRPTHA
ncbi:hypothetical protein E2C01_055353 [Portunus trituberculatus]|uniref:Uncharacterized protein n=1 Tax=Portunus trituberculatus TaxID=210409 RepID=A0A5B7GV20_PORTR|nr:hypothetical protein [Portunus trituberculatus]